MEAQGLPNSDGDESDNEQKKLTESELKNRVEVFRKTPSVVKISGGDSGD